MKCFYSSLLLNCNGIFQVSAWSKFLQLNYKLLQNRVYNGKADSPLNPSGCFPVLLEHLIKFKKYVSSSDEHSLVQVIHQLAHVGTPKKVQ